MTPADLTAARELAQSLNAPVYWFRGTASGKLIDDHCPKDAAALLNRLADEVEALRKDAEMLRFLLGDADSLSGRFNTIYMRWSGEGGIAGFKAEIQRWVDANAAMKEQSNG